MLHLDISMVMHSNIPDMDKESNTADNALQQTVLMKRKILGK